jgi:competence protein ComEA
MRIEQTPSMRHKFKQHRLFISHRGGLLAKSVLLSVLATYTTFAASETLPDGPGRDAVLKLCSNCHEPTRVVTRHQSRAAWQSELTKMIALGAKVTDTQFAVVLEYLGTNFPPPENLVNVNSASDTELELALQIPHGEALAIVRYRDENGVFNCADELKKVPGVNARKIDANKDRVSF